MSRGVSCQPVVNYQNLTMNELDSKTWVALLSYHRQNNRKERSRSEGDYIGKINAVYFVKCMDKIKRTVKQILTGVSRMVDVPIKKRILIIDDERDVGDSIKIVLSNYGFDVDSFTDGIEALKNFKPHFYDLVILDVRMPEIDGFDLYDKFKSKDPNIRTLFLTALGDVEAYRTTSNKVYPVMGERHFAKKPISNGDLLEQVYSIMN